MVFKNKIKYSFNIRKIGLNSIFKSENIATTQLTHYS